MNLSKMKLLYLTSFASIPSDQGGKLRGKNIISFLSDLNFEVEHIFFYKTKEEKSSTESFCIKNGIQPIGINKYKSNKATNALMSIFSILPYDIYKQCSNSNIRELKRCINIKKYDVIIVSRLSMLWALKESLVDTENVKIIYDQHDFSREFWRSYFQNNKILKKIWGLINYYKCKISENKLYQIIDCFISVSDEEKKLTLSSFPDTRGLTIKNGVDANHYSPNMLNDNLEYDLYILGSYDQDRNISAAKFVVKGLLPKLISIKPNIKIGIIGRNPPIWLRELADNNNNLYVSGFVEDERKFISKIMLAPFFFGAGVKHKVLIGMSCGSVVIGTKNAFQGINVIDQNNAIVCDEDIKIFANEIISILDNRERFEFISKNARSTILETYSWDIVLKDLKKELMTK